MQSLPIRDRLRVLVAGGVSTEQFPRLLPREYGLRLHGIRISGTLWRSTIR